MCTVTFIASGDKFFITHNRDEKSIRSKALPPKEYVVSGHRLLFPRDSHAGGTWIAMHENGNAAVLLNGGFVKHELQPHYRRSRGLVFLDIAAASDLHASWQRSGLQNIEPFTMILWNEGHLYECRWDGNQKHARQLNPLQAYTWSSVTLYDAEVITRREAWFADWLRQHPHPSASDITNFHLFGGDGDTHNNLRMNRDGIMLTVSITSMEISRRSGVMQYLDLQDNTDTTNEILFTKAPVIK
jgi:uncharacterized protein with NRDE domain